ncbi:glycosyltransferase [Rubidibacter lacunae KORDI 51-2]|uniref:Glycosyltransferase n=1 Tax=Rubidibacter lacunae KORDI 51-2 TaxID=582515 RepID=U5DFP3_9CHRO|nr:glycosyltransferase family 1 protein [Rubidibacter lacunae]ERN40082.1 glycosyltransferase [Rubidibacter lacunae KORDI 51-2]
MTIASTRPPIAPHVALISVHGDPAAAIGGEEAGGQNVYVRQVGESLAARGWQVDLFTRRATQDAKAVVEHGPSCRTIRLPAGPPCFIPRQEIFTHAGEFVAALQQYARREGRRYALLHSNYWISGWVGLQLKHADRMPLVHTYHSLGAVKYRSVSEPPHTTQQRLEIERDCLEQSNCAIATSPQERDDLRSLVSERGRIEIVPCGTDVRRFGSISRLDARAHLGIDPAAKVIFYVGRFDRRKGIETLVRAVRASESFGHIPLRAIIGGGFHPGQADGRERERLGALACELGLEDTLEFSGRISDADLPAYYAAADVCVVPSHYEPFGLVAIEAMACGTPVIASNVGGLKFTVAHEETGLLVPPQDATGFAIALDRVLGNPDWRDRLGAAGRQRVQAEFSWDGVADRLSALYERVIAESSASDLTVSPASAGRM